MQFFRNIGVYAWCRLPWFARITGGNVDQLLLEDGFNFLLEDDCLLLLEPA